MRLVLFFLLVLSVLCMSQTIEQKCIEKPIYELSENGKGKIVGSIEVKEQGKGIAIHVVASGLKPGQYGFHMHEKNTMSNTTDDKGNTVIGGGLGGHWDPDNTHKHAGPHGDGHRGDLEMLQVGKEGTVDQTVISTRIPFKAVKGKAFVIHAMPDNFTDHRCQWRKRCPYVCCPLFRDYNDLFLTLISFFTRNSMDHFCNLVAGIFPYFCIRTNDKRIWKLLVSVVRIHILMPEIVGILMISKEPDF